MKKYLKISAVLAVITLVCAVVLASINLLTADLIAKHEEEKKEETIKAIYDEYDHYKTESYDELVANYPNKNIDSVISERITVFNDQAEASPKGYIYSVSKRNAYGIVSLMVAISPSNTIVQVEFLENGQSFASTVDNWVKSNFISKGVEKYEAGFVSDDKVGSELSDQELYDLNVKCTATYGATTVKELVIAALNTQKEVA